MVTHQKITSTDAPKALGPYSQGIKAGPLVFVSGQLPIDLATGQLSEGSIQLQTHLIFSHLQAILKESGCTLQDVVRVEVFLTDLANFQEMNEVYASYFSHSTPPARQTIQVAKLPLNSEIEISCIAYKA